MNEDFRRRYDMIGKLLTGLLTKNLQVIPLLRVDFNMKKFNKSGKKDSCMLVVHPVLRNDAHVITTMNKLCDYIRDNYDMEDLV